MIKLFKNDDLLIEISPKIIIFKVYWVKSFDFDFLKWKIWSSKSKGFSYKLSSCITSVNLLLNIE